MTKLLLTGKDSETIDCPITGEGIKISMCVLKSCKYEKGHFISTDGGHLKCGYDGLKHDCNYRGS